MEDRTVDVVYNIGLLVIVVGTVAFFLWQMVKRTRAMRDPVSDDECVSCGSRSVVVTAPGRYTCNDCGYVGGSGVAAAQATALRQQIESLPPAERHRAGLGDLQEARTLLVTIVEGGSVAIGESSSSLGTTQADLQRAKQHMQLASLKLADGYLAVAPDALDPSGAVGADVISYLDGQALGGGVLDSAMAMGNLSAIKQEAAALLQRVDAALGHHGQRPPT